MPHHKVHQSVRKIREMLPFPPPERSWTELRQHLDLFGSCVRQAMLTNPGDTAAAVSDLTVLLADLARTAVAPELFELALTGLSRCGDFGTIILHEALITSRIPLKALRQLLGAWPVMTQLALIDRALGYRPWAEDDLKSWSFARLGNLPLDNPADALNYLRALDAKELTATPLLAANLADGVLAPYLTRSLSQPGSLTELMELLATIRPLRASYLSIKLVRFLRSNDPSVCGPVLKTVATIAEPGNRTVIHESARLLTERTPAVSLAALETLIASRSPELDMIFIHLAGKHPDLVPALALRLALAEARTFRNVMDAVSQETGERILPVFFILLCRLQPSRISALLEKVLSEGLGPHLEDSTRAALRQLIPHPARPAPPEIPVAAPRPAAGPEIPSRPAGDRKPARAALLGRFPGAEPYAQDDQLRALAGTDVHNAQFSKRDFSHLRLVATRFVRAVFQDCLLDSADLSRSVFEGCSFKGCRFTNSRLAEAVFKDCVLLDCTFAQCVCNSSVWQGCNLRDSTFQGCVLTRSVFDRTGFFQLGLEASSLLNARLHKLDYECGRLRLCDLTGCVLTSCVWTGVRLEKSLLAGVSLLDCRFMGTPLLWCLIHSCGIADLISDEVTLLDLEDADPAGRIRHLERAVLDTPIPVLDAEALAVIREVIESWFRIRDMRRSERRFLAYNEKRRDWAAHKTSEAKADFFRLVPFLIHSSVFERLEAMSPRPPACRVAGYCPDLDTLELSRKYFSGSCCTLPQADALPVEAIYTIGSVGTIAQTGRSDLDYWVCCDFHNRSEADREGLRVKLERIADYAERNFGVETHFFLMDVNAVLNNDFGSSDTESSGSAQAMMLKEEFYRTALRCAGKELVWWLTPPECDDLEYMEFLWLLSGLPEARKYVDMGNLRAIPPGEFFGASLWQIVKAFKNPFKSLMKFALLEKYVTSDSAQGGYLCDRIKANLLADSAELLDIDPYAVMFKETTDYYRTSGDKAGQGLIQLAFNLKTDIARGAQINPPHGLSLVRLMEELQTASTGLGAGMPDGSNVGQWSFQHYVQVGNLINNFMLKTYKRIQDRASTRTSLVHISSSDLTRLGRRIFTTFARRQYKIERMPFIASHHRFFSELHFSCDLAFGGKRTWTVHGHKSDEALFRYKLMEIRKQTDLAAMLGWLIANNIFEPDTLVKTNASTLPVMADDIENLLHSLRTFFPEEETFDVPLDESLKPERVVKAFFILNLATPRDKEEIIEATVIYTTNWGEFFCLSRPILDQDFQMQPEAMLTRNVPQDTAIRPVMDYFIPERSRCPAPLIY